MNVSWGDNYIDATNTFIGGGGGGTGGDVIINNNSSNNNLGDYINTSNVGSDVHLYINNPNTDGEIRFKVKSNINNPNYPQDHTIRITKDGKLELYHVYNPFQPTYASGWYDIEDKLIGILFGNDLQQIELVAIGGTLGLIEGQITDLYSLIALLQTSIGEINQGLNLTQDAIENAGILSETDYDTMENLRDSYNQIFEDFSSINDRSRSFTQTVINGTSFVTGNVSSLIQGGQTAFPIVAGIVGGIYGLIENEKNYNRTCNISNVNFTFSPFQRRQLADSNLSNAIIIANDLNVTLSNGNISQGFINSNIITTQFVPSLKSNKVLLGNITTPNDDYQMEMTGDLNANEYYRNSTSLTSLLAQKQDNMSATQPIFITTANIGLNYDSSLTKVGNNLSVVKTASAPLRWSGNNLILDYDSTLLNNSGNLGVSIGAESKWAFTGANIYNKTMTNVGIGTDRGISSYKFNVVGESYFSSNVNIAISKLNFISSYTTATLTQVTGVNEYYLQYTANGTLILNEPCACDLLIVGAGGNGGTGASSGGGGAGEVIYYPNFPLRSGTLNITVGTSSTTPSNRITKINHSSGDQIKALGGGNGGTPVFYTTSGGTVSALTAISGTSDAYISITAGTTLTLNANCSADILVVGGGGSGGIRAGGGGGAGAVIYNTNKSLNSGTYTITIGAGGVITVSDKTANANGKDTTINYNSTNIYIAKGGGAGDTGTGGGYLLAQNGGSGGGSTYQTTPAGVAFNTENEPDGIYGNNGAVGSLAVSGVQSSYCGGGGGGAGSAGVAGSNNTTTNQATGGNGGNGTQISITGVATYYGGGGGGGTGVGGVSGGSGGLGGGGNGSLSTNAATSGSPNTGGGGGGSGFNGGSDGVQGNGGSGIVIIRFKNYLTINGATSGGSGGGGGKNQLGAAAGVKFDDYKSLALAGLNGTSTTGGNGGSGNTTYNTRYTTTITGSSLSVALGGSGVSATPATPATKTNYGDGGDGNGGTGYQGIVIIRFKEPSSYLQLKATKDNANTGLILNANESPNVYQLRLYPWSDTYQLTGISTRGWSMRVHDGNNHLDLLNLFSSFGGRIGIKTKNPTATLDVNGDIACKTFSVVGNELYGITCQVVNQDVIGEASINISAGASGNYGAMSVVYLPSENLGYINCSKSLQIKTQSIGGYIHIDNTTGYVGIGNNLPQAKLHVSGTILASSVSVTTVNADSVAAGNISCTSLDLNNGSIIDCNRLNSVDVWTGPVKATSLDLDGGNITNGGFFYGMAQQARFLNMSVNEWHYDTQSRNRFYFTNDGTSSHTVFRTGSTTHYFQDKDAVDYCLLDRFGISTYFEVISGGGYDNLGVTDASSTGVYVYRRMLVRLSTFTEVHRCFIEDETYTNYDDFINEFVGRVVVSKGKIKTALKEVDKQWEIFEGKDGITIDDSHPVVELSRKKKDKAVVGVITKRNQNNDLPDRLVINSLGETAIWVVNSGGCIETGDLITTSNELGYAEKQDCDFIKNYTIGKCLINCNFELDNPNYKCEVIDTERDLRRAFLPIFIYSG